MLTRSATALAREIRTGRLRSSEVVEAHIQRVEDINPRLNALVATRFEEARAEAKAADDRLDAEGPDGLPPLHGVPCTIKECFALTGMPQSSGLPARKDVISDRDATTVARLRAAGAIPLGVSNLSELCMWMESSNPVYGRTNNPYDPTRIVGGSSGGEGAIIAAGGSPFGLGSDIGGSIRMPAFFNGVFGHKPTGGMVPGSGQHPLAENEALRYLTTGPLTRRAEDLFPLLEILAGPDGEDEGVLEFELGNPANVDVSTLRVVIVESNGFRSVSKPLRASLEKAGNALAQAGATVEILKLPALKQSLQIWAAKLTAANGTPFRNLMGEGEPLSLWRSIGPALFSRKGHTLPAVALSFFESLSWLVRADDPKILEAGDALRHEVLDAIGPHGVLLFPPYTRTAPRHGRPILTPFDWTYTAIWNVLENPVTSVPMGLDAQGLPLGIQVVGRHGHDHVPIAVAEFLENALGGWVPPWAVGRP